MVYHRILNILPSLHSRTLLFIYSIYNRLHLLIPTSHSIPPLASLLLGNHKSVLCFVDKFICVRV